MADDHDPRIVQLQETLCHLERLVEHLHEALLAHGKRTDELAARLTRLERRVDSAADEPSAQALPPGLRQEISGDLLSDDLYPDDVNPDVIDDR